MLGMLGSFPYSMDAKGRVFIPSVFRERYGDSFVLIKSVKHQCISIFTPEQWEEYIAKLKTLPKLKTDDVMHFLCASAASVTCDSQGRVVVPPVLRDFAKIEKEVMIVGVEDRAEIWSADAWREYDSRLGGMNILTTLEEIDF